jgi:peptide methionine sulfoxide reductase msrA/msrB
MQKKRWIVLMVYIGLTLGCAENNQKGLEKNMSQSHIDKKNIETATFAGGCFWCMEPPYDNLDGVISTVVGYTGGTVQNPSYEEVSTGTTGHLEAVQITFDSTKTSYEDLLQVYWQNIDPTDPNGQFVDKGSQYETAIFYHDERQKKLALKSKEELAASGRFSDPILTKILPAVKFYPAEEYHQEFYKNHPLRYNGYKAGSGRAGYLKEKWGRDK